MASAKLLSVRLSVAAIISPPGFTISAQRATNSVDIGDVLDHLHGQHDVEALAGVRQRPRPWSRGSRSRARCPRRAPRRRDIVLRRIGADDVGAEPRQRLGQDAAAAADIEHAQAVEAVELLGVAAETRGRLVADVAEPHRIELVQRRHLAARVPPLGGERGETRDLGRVDGGCAAAFG